MTHPAIIYISCSARSLKRDLQILCNGQDGDTRYKLERISVLDQFAGTDHMETCVYLRRIPN